MHYFIYGPHIAAVENADQAAKYAAAEWRAVSRETFIAAWRARDMQALARLRRGIRRRMATATIEWLPRGWARYNV